MWGYAGLAWSQGHHLQPRDLCQTTGKRLASPPRRPRPCTWSMVWSSSSTPTAPTGLGADEAGHPGAVKRGAAAAHQGRGGGKAGEAQWEGSLGSRGGEQGSPHERLLGLTCATGSTPPPPLLMWCPALATPLKLAQKAVTTRMAIRGSTADLCCPLQGHVVLTAFSADFYGTGAEGHLARGKAVSRLWPGLAPDRSHATRWHNGMPPAPAACPGCSKPTHTSAPPPPLLRPQGIPAAPAAPIRCRSLPAQRHRHLCNEQGSHRRGPAGGLAGHQWLAFWLHAWR